MRRFDALARPFGIRCTDPHTRQALDRLLASFAVSAPDRPPIGPIMDLAPGPTGGWVLRRDGALVTAGSSWAAAVPTLLAGLNHEAVDTFEGFAVHAGVVAMDEVAVALPGRSGAGKSTLTAACVLAGFDYVSDEALCIDRETARIVRYPKPLSLSRSSWRLLGRPEVADATIGVRDGDGDEGIGDEVMGDGDGEVMVGVADLGGRVAEPDLRLGHVVELDRRDGAPRLVAQPRQHALTSLLAMSFNHYKEPQASFELVSRLAGECSAWRLEYDDPLDAAELLRAELAPASR